MNYVCDGILILVIALCVVFSMKRGFISASRKIVALILTAILLSSAQPVVLGFLQSTPISAATRNMVAKNVSSAYKEADLPEDTDTTQTEETQEIIESLKIPKFMQNGISDITLGMTEIKNNVMEVIIDAVTLMILKFLAVILLFLVVKLFVFLILKLLESLFEMPGLKTINKLLGACLGIVNSLLLIYLVCGAVSLFAPADKLTFIEETVKSTYILKYFYENNILMSLFV